VVGSRQATRLGCSQAYHLSHDLAKEGFTVVSGMASGIDTFSHRGAIAADGRTIAVFGSGLDQVYPSHNLKLAEEISRRGALISEFPLGTRPMRYNFPRRNRIISGLSLGVIVVEAALRSGALITATFALEQGRDVFALPGGVGGKNSAGVNKLIKEGAKLVEGVSDVLEEYEHILGTREKTDRRPHLGELGRVEMDILELLKGGPRPVDELIGDSNISSHEVLSSLTQLELKGAIQRLPGRMFSRIT
jgi:DNA processing protein